ncbi:hypothetical protein [Bradyrhizobium sp. BR 1432]|uniref:hypothetical protein n=1 Tax=Bradyrhizobium sp. BR 1432 TaxID=3447966 RepID=UPI003EE702D3
MSAMFELIGGGIGVMPDPEDNEAGHVVPHHESGTRVSFSVVNVGDAGGNAEVGIELDDVFTNNWTSDFLDPGQQQAGFVGLGRLLCGEHEVLIFVNPGSGQADHETNTFTVE